MRYINNSTRSVHCSRVGSTIPPGRKSREIKDFATFMDALARDGHGMQIELSKEDLASIDRLLSVMKPPAGKVVKAAKAAGKDPKNERAVYEANESYYILKKKLVSARIEEHNRREARINSESNFILPDGTPVGKEDNNVVQGLKVKEGTKVEPKYVERPQSPLDILAHNAKVSTERAQTSPLKGKAAVDAHRGITPGMPSFPGVEKQMENLAREQAMANMQKAGMQPVLTSEMLSSGEKNNYGRK